MRIHFKPLLILFIPSIAVSLYKIMDKIMLKSLSDAVQVGYYENSEKIITIPQGIIAAVGTVMLPKMSNLVIKNDKNSMQKYLDFSIQGVMFIAIALMFGLAGIANEFAPVYFGNEFTSCGIIISGLAITIPFISFANIIRTQFLIPNSKDNVYVISVIIGAILNLSINRLLIPYFQAMGAVIGTIAAEVSVCFIQCIAVRNELPFKKYFRNILPFPLLGIIMYIAVRVIGKNMGGNFVTVIIEITTGAFIYLGLGIILFYTRNKKQVNN